MVRFMSLIARNIHVGKVIPDDTRDRAEALLLLARATIEKGGASGEGLGGADPRRGAGNSSSEALETGIAHLRAALQVRRGVFAAWG